MLVTPSIFDAPVLTSKINPSPIAHAQAKENNIRKRRPPTDFSPRLLRINGVTGHGKRNNEEHKISN